MKKNFYEYVNLPLTVIFALLICSLLIMFPILDMIILGAVLAYGVRPLSKKLKSKVKYSSISILLAIIIILIPILLLLGYVLFVILGYASNLISSGYFTSESNFNETAVFISNYVHVSPEQIINTFDDVLVKFSEIVVNYIISLVKNIPFLMVQIFILAASTYYFTKDGDKCYNFIRSFVSENNMEFFDSTVESIKDVIKSIFYGHFLTAIIIGVVAAIGYSILGYVNGPFFGIITGVCQLIPVIGPWPVYTVLCIFDLFTGNYIRAIIVLLFGFVLSVSDMYIRPALSSHYADIPPLILLIGFLAGPLVYGIVGLIMGPLLLGMAYVVLKNYKEVKNGS